jgi:hypothetical protein
LNKALAVFKENGLIDGCDVTLRKDGLTSSWDIKLIIREEEVFRLNGEDNMINYVV